MKRFISLLLLLTLSGCAAPSAQDTLHARRSGADPVRAGSPQGDQMPAGAYLGLALLTPLMTATAPLWLIVLPFDKMKHDAALEKAKAASQPDSAVNPLPQTS